MGLSLSTVYAGTTHYTVHSGDSLYKIALQYNTSVAHLKSWNHLDSNLILPGQRLIVGQTDNSSKTSTSKKANADSKSSSSSSTYTVQRGDSLWSISRHFGVSLSHLESWNHLNSKSILHVGQKLTIKGAHQSITLGSRSASPDASVATAARGMEIAQYAEKYNGVPYRWGGTSPNGFDCSGLVQYVFAHFGISLPRTSYDQYREGSSVSKANLQPGDILFFNTYGRGASHDGIYVGNGHFINAASDHVEIDSLSNSYWSAHYIGARRV